jgi:hypothetical protein
VRYIDLTRYFCDRELCPPVAGNVLIYSDLNHITATYARTLSGPLEEAVFATLGTAADSPEPPRQSTGLAAPN